MVKTDLGRNNIKGLYIVSQMRMFMYDYYDRIQEVRSFIKNRNTTREVQGKLGSAGRMSITLRFKVERDKKSRGSSCSDDT